MSDLGNSDRRVIGNGDTYWYTGYAYYAQLEDDPNYIETTPPYTVHPQQGVVVHDQHFQRRVGAGQAIGHGVGQVVGGVAGWAHCGTAC